jgi:hypothetical protein
MKKNCPICGASGHPQFSAQVLGKYQAAYFLCEDCEFLWIDDPHWIEEAYSSAIADSDTGLVMRNIEISRKLGSLLYWYFGERGRGKYLDAAGGYGLLTRLMRDYGFDFFWQDKYCPNVLARGFEYSHDRAQCEAVTAFEVLEHLINPLGFIRDSLEETGSKNFIFSTKLYEGAPPNPGDWWYYSLKTGQHIGFFSKKTLQTMADKLGMAYFSSNGLHMFTAKSCSPIKVDIFTNKYFSYFAARWAKYILGTKTFSDSQFVLEDG